MKALTLRLPFELWEKLKIMAVKERRPLSELLLDAVQQYIKSHKRAA